MRTSESKHSAGRQMWDNSCNQVRVCRAREIDLIQASDAVYWYIQSRSTVFTPFHLCSGLLLNLVELTYGVSGQLNERNRLVGLRHSSVTIPCMLLGLFNFLFRGRADRALICTECLAFCHEQLQLGLVTGDVAVQQYPLRRG